MTTAFRWRQLKNSKMAVRFGVEWNPSMNEIICTYGSLEERKSSTLAIPRDLDMDDVVKIMNKFTKGFLKGYIPLPIVE